MQVRKRAKEDKEAHIDKICAGKEQSHRSGKTKSCQLAVFAC